MLPPMVPPQGLLSAAVEFSQMVPEEKADVAVFHAGHPHAGIPAGTSPVTRLREERTTSFRAAQRRKRFFFMVPLVKLSYEDRVLFPPRRVGVRKSVV